MSHSSDDLTRAARADRYDRMLRLADLFDDAGDQMRAWAEVGDRVLADPAVADSAPLAPGTFADAEEEIRAATSGREGLLARSLELDADALVLRATVLTYRWIDDLRAAAYLTLGSVAGRAIGYLAPEVALGGTIVAAGLIETDALDRDGVAAYLNELAEANPELMEHVTTGGGLVDSLQMRSLLTAGVLASETGGLAREGGLRAVGITTVPTGFGAALRDAAVGVGQDTGTPDTGTSDTGSETGSGTGSATGSDTGSDTESDTAASTPSPREAGGGPRSDLTRPTSLAGLMTALDAAGDAVQVRPAGADRFVGYLPSARGGDAALVAGDASAYVDEAVQAIVEAVGTAAEPARVMLVGAGAGGIAAVTIAARTDLPGFVVDQVVTAGAPSAQVPRLPATVRVLALEDRSDPVALLGSLVNASSDSRTTVVYDAATSPEDDAAPYLLGARAADASDHPALVAELARLRDCGYLAGPDR